MTTLETLNFDNLALRSLPLDTEQDNFTRQVNCSGQATLYTMFMGWIPGFYSLIETLNQAGVLSPYLVD